VRRWAVSAFRLAASRNRDATRQLLSAAAGGITYPDTRQAVDSLVASLNKP
jgi:hypothetical protein